MALFDSDLLFFSEPTEFLRRVEDPDYTLNTFNEDCADGYAIPEAELRALVDHQLPSRINSGLGLVHRDSLRWDWIEDYLAIPALAAGHFWRIEQTLFALCSSRFGVELLPAEYSVHLDGSASGRLLPPLCRRDPALDVRRGDGTARRRRIHGGSTPTMKVLFAPDWRDGNPYQELLATALERKG